MFNAYIEQEPFFFKKQNPKTQKQKESTSFWVWLWAFNHGDLWYSDICTRMALVKKNNNNLSLLEMLSCLNTLSVLNSVFDRSLWSGSIRNLVMPYFWGFWHSYLHLLFSPCWRQHLQRVLVGFLERLPCGYASRTKGQTDEWCQRYSVIYFVGVERPWLPFRKPITPQEENDIISCAFSVLVTNGTAIP